MKKYRLQAIVLVLVAFMLGCNEFIMVGIISDIARQFSVSLATVGYLVTIFATVYAVSTPIITIYSSRFNRYKTLIVLMVIFLVGNTFTGLAALMASTQSTPKVVPTKVSTVKGVIGEPTNVMTWQPRLKKNR